MATEAETEAVVETLMEAASDAINDTVRFTQAQSAEMWGYLASEARTWQQTIKREMEEGGDDGDGGDDS